MCYRDGHLLNKLMVLSGLPPIPLLCSQVTLQRFKSKGLLWRDSIIYVTQDIPSKCTCGYVRARCKIVSRLIVFGNLTNYNVSNTTQIS